MGPLEAPAAPGHPRTSGPKTFPQPPALGLPQAPGASTGFGRTPGPGTAPDTVGSPRSWLWGPGPAAAAALGLLAAPARGHGLGVCCGTPQAGSGFGKPYSRNQSPTTIPVPGPRCYLPQKGPCVGTGPFGVCPGAGGSQLAWPRALQQAWCGGDPRLSSTAGPGAASAYRGNSFIFNFPWPEDLPV